eukprot:COSAG05_NODE_1388_length_5007_cov_2.253260_2_plen_154_part_00
MTVCADATGRVDRQRKIADDISGGNVRAIFRNFCDLLGDFCQLGIDGRFAAFPASARRGPGRQPACMHCMHKNRLNFSDLWSDLKGSVVLIYVYCKHVNIAAVSAQSQGGGLEPQAGYARLGLLGVPKGDARARDTAHPRNDGEGATRHVGKY